MEPTLEFVVNLIKEAGEILRNGYEKKHIIEYKAPTDLVTEIDRLSENYIVKQIKHTFPTHSIITEESGEHDGKKSKRWFIDPVDGTSNYSRGLPMFSVSIAYAENSVMKLGCVYDPIRDECFSAEIGKGAWLNGNSIRVSSTNTLIHAMLVTGFPYDLSQGDNNIKHFTDLIMKVHTIRRLGGWEFWPNILEGPTPGASPS